MKRVGKLPMVLLGLDLLSVFGLIAVIGFWWGVLWLATAVVLGISILRQVSKAGLSPAVLAQRMYVLLAAVLLVLPGVLSDVVALMLLVPKVRQALAAKQFAQMQVAESFFAQSGFGRRGNVFESEVVEVYDEHNKIVGVVEPVNDEK